MSHWLWKCIEYGHKNLRSMIQLLRSDYETLEEEDTLTLCWPIALQEI